MAVQLKRLALLLYSQVYILRMRSGLLAAVKYWVERTLRQDDDLIYVSLDWSQMWFICSNAT